VGSRRKDHEKRERRCAPRDRKEKEREKSLIHHYREKKRGLAASRYLKAVFEGGGGNASEKITTTMERKRVSHIWGKGKGDRLTFFIFFDQKGREDLSAKKKGKGNLEEGEVEGKGC